MPIKGKTGTPARLASGIRGRICKNDNGEDFIPNDAIDELASLENVQHHLEAKPQHLKGASVDTFMNFVADQKKPAKKVFLILVYCDLLEYLSSMCEVGFCDQYLPIEPKWNEPQDRYDVRTKHWQKPEPFNKWSTCNIEIFEAKQWVFMAPVFNAHQFEYTVSPKCPLPIIGRPGHSKGGYSGSVREVEIHKAHLQIQFKGTCKRIALKEIHDDKQDYYKKELESLSMIRPLRHSHLIQPLAAYTRVRLQGFLFPWAEGGNLEEFWRRDTKLAAADRGLMRWVLHQLCGLCGATKKLHTKNCRHTDLKPANILLFPENGYPKTPGTLRIADVGLAKIHDDETRQRKAITQAKTGSVRYEPPELGREDQLSRVYDVWCLGCVFLEFLIWGVYGWKFFSDFSNNTRQLQFWEQTADGEIQQHQHVKTIIAKMFRDLKSGNTKRQSALEDCLELVDKRMLVPNWREREVVARLHTDLERIRKKGNEKEGYLLNRRLTIPESTNLNSPGAGNLNAGKLEIPVTSAHAQEYNLSEARKLNDQWQSRSDNDFAQRLLATLYHDSASTPKLSSELCLTCANTWANIWNMDFSISDQMAELRKRTEGCALCGLLYQAAKDIGLSDSDSLKCHRVESTMRLEPDGPTILSIYADPGDHESAPPYAQLGYAQLPHPGSDSQTTLFKEWLRVCEEQHNHQFNYKAGFPTRVLDVGTPEHPQIRLCDGTKAISKRYVALSHCWGTEQCFKTLKNNINDFKKEIGFKELPRTFQDAVKVTRDLGFRYLWIDSLCIIQDDLLDWEQEAASMEHVFSSAIVTIAASSAKSSAEGFLLAQRKQQTPVIIKTASNGTAFICKSIDDFHRDVEMSPLNKRGWVLQERALARRTLHFTSSQVYWECGNGIHGESLMKLVNPRAAFLGDSDFPNSALGYFKGARILLFQNLYRTYSALNFTHVTDRSIAIKGLEERLVKAFNTKGGFGIFERYLHRSLLWQRESDSPLVRITDPPGTHIPSWSWMAYSGRISYLEAPFDGINWQDYVQSPLTSESGVKQHWKADQISIVGYMLRGPMRKLNLEATELGGRITFDQEERATVRDLGCIVLGVKRLASL